MMKVIAENNGAESDEPSKEQYLNNLNSEQKIIADPVTYAYEIAKSKSSKIS